jgi:hypothetical protein
MPVRAAEAPLPPGRRLPPAVLMLLAWLVPGLGHLLLGKRSRAAVFAAVVVVGFVAGILIEGELIMPRAGDPLSYLAAFANLGSGILFFAARFAHLGEGVVTAVSWEYGNTFLLTAGMMNLLLVLDTHDIAAGRKD